MALPPQSRNGVYIVGLGGAGGTIVAKFAEMNLPLLRTESFEQQIERSGLALDVEIIDMVPEPNIRDYINSQPPVLKDGDNIITPQLPHEAYMLRTIASFAEGYLPHILEYYRYLENQIRLQFGGGVSRYRPLARYFIYCGTGASRPFLQELYQDIYTDFGPFKLGSANISRYFVIYNVSAGGGFGSGSLLDIMSIIDHYTRFTSVSADQRAFFHIILPANYSVKPEGKDLVLESIEDSQASAAAMLLELLYVMNKLKMSHGGYRDRLTNVMAYAMGIDSEAFAIKTDDVPVKLSYLILASYNNIMVTGEEGVNKLYEIFDEKAAALLTAMTSIAIPRGIFEDNRLNQRFPLYEISRLSKVLFTKIDEEEKDIVSKVPVLFTPVAIYDARVIKLDLRDNVIKELAKKAEEIKISEDKAKQIDGRIDELSKRSETYRAMVKKVEEIRSKLEEIKRAELPSDIQRRIQTIENIIGSITTSLSELKSKIEKEEYAEARQIISRISNLSEGLSTEVGELSRRIGGMIQVLSLDPIEIIYRNLENATSLEALEAVNRSIDNGRDDIRNLMIWFNVNERLKSIAGQLDASMKTRVEDVRKPLKERCSLFKREPCRLLKSFDQVFNVISSQLNTINASIRSLDTKTQQIQQILNKIDNKITSLNRQLEDESRKIDEERNKLNEERDKLEKSNKDLERQIEKLKEEAKRIILAKNIFLPESAVEYLVNRIVKRVESGENIENLLRELTISKLYEELMGIDPNLADLLKGRVLSQIDEFKERGSYLVNYPRDVERLAVEHDKERVISITNDFYVVLSRDEEKLQDAVKERVDGYIDYGEKKVEVSDNIRGSYIIVVKVKYGLPLIAINEFRALIKRYKEPISRDVYKLEPKPLFGQVVFKQTGKLESRREPRGRMFHCLTLLPESAKASANQLVEELKKSGDIVAERLQNLINNSKDFEEFINNVIFVVEKFENHLQEASSG